MHDLRHLASALASSEDKGVRPTATTLAYLLHHSRPESYADSTEAQGTEPLTLVAAELASLYLAGLATRVEFVNALEQLIEEEQTIWAARKRRADPG